MHKRLDGITAPQILNIWPLNCLHNGNDIVGGDHLDATCLINGPAAAAPVPKEAVYTDCICETTTPTPTTTPEPTTTTPKPSTTPEPTTTTTKPSTTPEPTAPPPPPEHTTITQPTTPAPCVEGGHALFDGVRSPLSPL